MKNWIMIPIAALLLSMGVLWFLRSEKETVFGSFDNVEVYDGPDQEEDEYIRPLPTAFYDFHQNYGLEDLQFTEGKSFRIRTKGQRELALQVLSDPRNLLALKRVRGQVAVTVLADENISQAQLKDLHQTLEASLHVGDRLVQIFFHHTSGKNHCKHKPAGWAILGEVGIHYSRGLRYHSLLMPEGIPGELRYREALLSRASSLQDEDIPGGGEVVSVQGPLRLYGPDRRDSEFRSGIPAAIRVSKKLGLWEEGPGDGMGYAGESVK